MSKRSHAKSCESRSTYVSNALGETVGQVTDGLMTLHGTHFNARWIARVVLVRETHVVHPLVLRQQLLFPNRVIAFLVFLFVGLGLARTLHVRF